jgi:hypothetical protein
MPVNRTLWTWKALQIYSGNETIAGLNTVGRGAILALKRLVTLVSQALLTYCYVQLGHRWACSELSRTTLDTSLCGLFWTIPLSHFL